MTQSPVQAYLIVVETIRSGKGEAAANAHDRKDLKTFSIGHKPTNMVV